MSGPNAKNPVVQEIDFSLYDGLEVSPVAQIMDEADGDTYCERLESTSMADGEASFWTVYGHCIGGGCESLWDFPSRDSAMQWAAEMADTHVSLQKHGVWEY